MWTASKAAVLAALVLGFATACTGELADIPPDPCAPGTHPGPAPVRRMTRFEYDNTVRDLLGDTTKPAQDFPLDEEALGFDNNAANLTVSSTLAEKYMRAAEGISERATENLSAILPCDPATGEEACAQQFIQSFGKKAFRRPLTAAESDDLHQLYLAGRSDGDFRIGIELVIQGALQSPAFLYRLEFGAPPANPSNKVVRLDDWEMASRLSYFLWGSMPDDTLFAAAEAGTLHTNADIETQARRMLSDPRARQAVLHFHTEWLDFDRIANAGKNAQIFPEWSQEIGGEMRQETDTFFDRVVFDEEGTLNALLTAPYSFMDATLAAFYGLQDPGGAPGEFVKVPLDPAQRAGILTQGTILAINAHSDQTSPVHRGKLVRERFLCDIMPPPPPDIVITVPEYDPTSTARERFEEHVSNPACSGCHVMMDPIGFGFENYDGIGRWRTMEAGQSIDSSGEVVATADIDGVFNGAVQLTQKLAASRDVTDCYTIQWFRWAYGRGEADEDACTIADLNEDFAIGGGNVQDLIVSLTQTDAFLYKRVSP